MREREYHWDAWAFPFHESCWQILRLVRPGGEINAQGPFDICLSCPVQANTINYGHDYGRRAMFSKWDYCGDGFRR